MILHGVDFSGGADGGRGKIRVVRRDREDRGAAIAAFTPDIPAVSSARQSSSIVSGVSDGGGGAFRSGFWIWFSAPSAASSAASRGACTVRLPRHHTT